MEKEKKFANDLNNQGLISTELLQISTKWFWSFYGKVKDLEEAKQYRKEKAARLRQPNFKYYRKATVNKISWHCKKNRNTEGAENEAPKDPQYR